MDSRIVLVGLDNQLVKDISNALADKLNMFFLDIDDLIKYNFASQEETIAKVGIDYYEKQIKRLAIGACDYENTVIYCPYDLLLDEEIMLNFKSKTKIIFLNIPKMMLVNQNMPRFESEKLDIQILAYEELTKQLENISNYNFIFSGNNVIDIVNEIVAFLEKHYA